MNESGAQLQAPHVIIAGFGLPGRFVAEQLAARSVSYTVIELNAVVAERVRAGGTRVVVGDAREEGVLREAGIEQASVLALTFPDEKLVVEALHVAQRMKPGLRIVCRCNYISTGMKIEKAGAAAIVAEQVVAAEFIRAIGNVL